MLIETNQADAVICVGSESTLTETFISGLAAAHALSTNNDDPKHASRPFDAARDGFVMGEGGGAIIIESEENAKKRNATILAEIAGYANSTDGYHATSPHPEGIGAIFCMEEAIRKAGISKEEVKYINTHGTSTPVGDPIEAKAIEKVFGEAAYDIAVNSTKGATGHMMGAGGITELITCIKCIETGIIPPTLNLENPDENLPKLNYVPNKTQQKKVDIAMSNSFGFGGQNSSILVKRY
ncbi:MAG: beta-ketoacyl-[acyl-carrier-protein] synthase family protein, partial [Lachnospiraceae bacterium]|nr:beta-ketoacyl-[acyl-carrier-protein] synthase family protein [Lachnospiraceae bacterium]